MSVFGWDPKILGRIFPQSSHRDTHFGHLFLTIIGGGVGAIAGALLPFTDGWWGFRAGVGVMGFFYIIREIEAHLHYRSEWKRGAIGVETYRVAIWDSKMDALVPWCYAGPILTLHLPVIAPVWILLWAYVMASYIARPEGTSGGMR